MPFWGYGFAIVSFHDNVNIEKKLFYVATPQTLCQNYKYFVYMARPEEELQSLFESELGFLEACLRVNPKSYGTWHHRGWVMDHMPKPDWQHELKLCNTCLELDERNCEYKWSDWCEIEIINIFVCISHVCNLWWYAEFVFDELLKKQNWNDTNEQNDKSGMFLWKIFFFVTLSPISSTKHLIASLHHQILITDSMTV